MLLRCDLRVAMEYRSLGLMNFSRGPLRVWASASGLSKRSKQRKKIVSSSLFSGGHAGTIALKQESQCIAHRTPHSGRSDAVVMIGILLLQIAVDACELPSSQGSVKLQFSGSDGGPELRSFFVELAPAFLGVFGNGF